MLPERDGDGFGAVRGADLAEEGDDVLLHHVERDAELPGDVAVGEASDHRGEDLGLARRELGDGRIVLPLSLFEKGDEAGALTCSVSDDDGRTWRRTCAPFKTFAADGTRVMTQEPGVVELKDGRLLMWARTLSGRQWACTSSDRGETWSKGEPWTLVSPLSPATVVRLRNGDLLAVWNDHESHPEIAAEKQLYGGTRRPLTLAVSKDEGRTWIHRLTLEDDPGHSRGWYCYFAALEQDDALLLAYCAEQWLQRSRVVRMPLARLYAAP